MFTVPMPTVANKANRDQYSIREVLAFPFMKDEQKHEQKLAAEEVGVEAAPVEETREYPSPPYLVLWGYLTGLARK